MGAQATWAQIAARAKSPAPTQPSQPSQGGTMTWGQAIAMAKRFTASGIVTTIYVRADNLSAEDVTRADEAYDKGVKGLQITMAFKGSRGSMALYYIVCNGAV